MQDDVIVTINIPVTIAVGSVSCRVRLYGLFRARLVEGTRPIVHAQSSRFGPVRLRDEVGAAELVQNAFDIWIAVGVGIAKAAQALGRDGQVGPDGGC